MRNALAYVLVSVVVSVGCSRSAAYYVDRGNRFFAQGKLADAAIEYRKALQKDRTFGEAYYRLGITELRQGDALGAFRDLSQAVRFAPANSDAAARFADLNLGAFVRDPHRSQSFYDEVVKLSNRLLDKNPNSVEGWRLKGALALLNKKPREAIEDYQKANRINPRDIDVMEGLVQALFVDDQPQEGEKVARTFLENNKQASAIYDVLYLHFLATNRLQDAENLLLTKVRNNSREVSYRLQLASFYHDHNRSEQVAEILADILKDPQDFPGGHLDVGDFYNRTGQHEQALQQFEAGSRQGSGKDQVIYRERIADTLVAEGRLADAQGVLERLIKEQPRDRNAARALAVLEIDRGDPRSLSVAVQQLIALLQETPSDPILHFELGRAYASQKNRAAARAELVQASSQKPDYFPPRLALAELDLTESKPQDALQLTEQILARDPGNPRARLLHAAAQGSLRRYGAARTELDSLIMEYPQSRDARIQLGVVAIAQKRFREAEKLLGSADLASDPRATAGLAIAYSAQDQIDQAIQLLRTADLEQHSPPAISNLLAALAVRNGNYDLAIETYKRQLTHNPNSAELNLSLGEVWFAKGDYTQASAALQRAKQLNPKDGRPDTMLAAILARSGRVPDMKAHLENVLRLQPDNPVALNNMAFFLAENHGNLDEALSFAQRAVARSRNEPNFVDTLGWIYFKKELSDSAIQIFSTLVKKQPSNPTFEYHLGAALLAKGETERARQALNAALAAGPARDEEVKIKELLRRIG